MSMLHLATYPDHRAQRARSSQRWHASWTVAALLCIAPLAACGGDDNGTPTTTPSTGGAGAGGSSAGTGGSAGAATMAAPQPVSCGSASCSPPSNPLSSLLSSFGGGVMGLPTPVGCCLDESSGKCGVAMGAGATCEAPAVADNRCQGINAGALGGLGGAGMSMAGCCIDNMCGQDGALFGRGCVENSQVKGMLSAIPLVGTLLTIPPARACDAPATTTPTDGDAGVDDAGI